MLVICKALSEKETSSHRIWNLCVFGSNWKHTSRLKLKTSNLLLFSSEYVLQPAGWACGWTLRLRLRLRIREETPESATVLSHGGGGMLIMQLNLWSFACYASQPSFFWLVSGLQQPILGAWFIAYWTHLYNRCFLAGIYMLYWDGGCVPLHSN